MKLIFSIFILVLISTTPAFATFDKTLSVTDDNMTYEIPYSMDKGTITNAILNCEKGSLFLFMNSDDGGILKLDIPDKLFSSIFMMFVNGEEFRDGISYEDDILTINYPKNTKNIEMYAVFALTEEKNDGVCDAEEFQEDSFNFEYHTGEIFQIDYELRNAKLAELLIERSTISFIVNSTNGELFVSFPKAVPLEVSEGLDYPLLIAIHNGTGYSPELEINTDFKQTANDCTFDVEFKFNNKIETTMQIDINHGMYPEGHQLTYVDLPEKCLVEDPRNDTKIQRQLNEKECTNSNYKKGLNIRDELVCISPESYPGLNQRGYLKTFPMIIQPFPIN